MSTTKLSFMLPHKSIDVLNDEAEAKGIERAPCIRKLIDKSKDKQSMIVTASENKHVARLEDKLYVMGLLLADAQERLSQKKMLVANVPCWDYWQQAA